MPIEETVTPSASRKCAAGSRDSRANAAVADVVARPASGTDVGIGHLHPHIISSPPSRRPTVPQDPKEQGTKPPFPQKEQAHPGSEREMAPRPDYGEESYRGLRRLRGRVALITGADSGIGRAVALAFA